jgi:methylated-DNA-[protein]-cysteine S-methyltransferase
MAQNLSYCIFSCSAGWIVILGSGKGLLRVTLPRPSEQSAQAFLDTSQAELSCNQFQDTVERFQAYYSGNKVDFSEKVDFSGSTSFQREVWQAARSIPYGETRTYGWLAAAIDRPLAARAVGQALGRNPVPVIIPCHRIIAGDGSLGGFTGGLDIKRFLLDLESGS